MARQRGTFAVACMEYLFGRTCCSRLDYVEPRVGGQLLNIRFNTSLRFCTCSVPLNMLSFWIMCASLLIRESLSVVGGL